MIISRSFILRMITVSDKSCRENQDTHFCSVPCLENRSVYDIMWKNIVEMGRPQMMVHAHFMRTFGYKYTLRICNTYYFFTAKLVERERVNVTLYVHCLSCLSFKSLVWRFGSFNCTHQTHRLTAGHNGLIKQFFFLFIQESGPKVSLYTSSSSYSAKALSVWPWLPL